MMLVRGSGDGATSSLPGELEGSVPDTATGLVAHALAAVEALCRSNLPCPGREPDAPGQADSCGAVSDADRGAVSDADRIDAIAALERIKGMIAAAQARLEVDFRDSQIAAQRAAGVPREHLGRGVADQIALARRMSPKTAADQLALRRVVVETLPCTFAHLAAGRISEWSAHEVAKAVIVLDDEDRARVDTDIAHRLPEVTAQRAGRLARARANELDQLAALRRNERAESQRCVSVRPAADGMVRLSALLPTRDGVGVYAALHRDAKALRTAGDPRSMGQIMADALVARATGLENPERIGVEVQLLMTDTALLAGASDAASIDGFPIPAVVARRIALGRDMACGDGSDGSVLGGVDGSAARWIRRLYTDPATGRLTGAEPRRRRFTGEVRRFIRLRDQHCRGPFCDAPVRDIDHVHRHADGGDTSAENGAGVCQRWNLAVEMPGWSTRTMPEPAPPGQPSDAAASRSGPDIAPGQADDQGAQTSVGAGAEPGIDDARPPGPPGTHGVPPILVVTTPTGHTYTSRAPVLRRPHPMRGEPDGADDESDGNARNGDCTGAAGI